MHRFSSHSSVPLGILVAVFGLFGCAVDLDDSVAETQEAVLIPVPFPPPPIPPLLLNYTITNAATGKNLDAPDYGRPGAAGDPVNQFTPHSGPNQRWLLLSAGTYTDPAGVVQNAIRIKNRWTGLCLDFFTQGITQQNCDDPARVNSTRFYRESDNIKTATGTPGTPFCIDVPNASPNDGVQVRRNGCNGLASERWAFTRFLN